MRAHRRFEADTAVAITGIEPDGRPHGVAVIHPGDFDITRGLIETGIQVLPEAEPIGGFKAYQVHGEVGNAFQVAIDL